MADIGVTLSAKRVLEKLGRTSAAINAPNLDVVLRSAAEEVLARARRRAPFQFGRLRDSDFVEDSPGTGRGRSVRFGFDTEYAGVMDQGWRTTVIRPVRAKALFIPLSARAARQGPRAYRRLKRGVDYTFAKQVIPPKPKKFADKGPNYYFSGTLEEFQREASPSLLLLGLARGVDFILQKIEGLTGIEQAKPVKRNRPAR